MKVGALGGLLLSVPSLLGQEGCEGGSGLWVNIESKSTALTRAKFGYFTSCNPTTLYLGQVFWTSDTYTLIVNGVGSWTHAATNIETSTITEEQRRNAWSIQQNDCIWGSDVDRVCTGSASYTEDPGNGDCATTASPPGCYDWDDESCAALVEFGLNSFPVVPQPVDCGDDYELYEFHQNSTQNGTTVIRDVIEQWTMTAPIYTDELLREDLLWSLEGMDYPGGWLPWDDVALYALNEEHWCGEGQKTKYRFNFDSAAGVNYRLTWNEVTHQPDGRTSRRHLEEVVVGTGAVVYSDEHEILPPAWDDYSDPSAGAAYVTVEAVKIQVDPSPSNPPHAGAAPGGGSPGAGHVGGPDGGGDCLSGDCAGSGIQPAEGVLVGIRLGASSYGGNVGALILSAQEPSPILSTPAGLQFATIRPEVDAVRIDGVLRQVKGPQAFADIVTINAYQYEVRLYYPSQVGTKSGATYPILDPNNPFVRWTIANPDASPTLYNTLRVTETRGVVNRVRDFVYAPATRTWTLTHPANTGVEESVVAENIPAGTREYTTTVRPPGGSTVLRVSRKYQQFTGFEGVVEESVGEGAEKRTTTFSYHTGYSSQQVNGNKLPLQQVLYPDGSWRRYAYDSNLRRTWVRASFGNQAPTDDNGLCRATSYDYAPVDVADDGSLESATPRTETHYLLDHEIGRTYRVLVPGGNGLASERRVYQCQTPGAAVSASDNLLTVTKYYLTGTFAGRPKCVNHPDGTRTAYLYSRSGSGTSATETTAVLVGQPDGANDTNILAGTVTTTVVGHIGQLVSRQFRDKASSTVLSLETYTYLDELKRSYTVTYLDGTSKTVQFACCGMDTVTDQNKVLHQYLYDDAGRVLGATDITHALTLTNVLDAAGNVRVSVRNAAGDLIPLDRRAYSTAGQLTLQTNALGGVTAYTETTNGQGQKVRTTTYPDGGTRVETYFKDGQLAKVTGTATQPSRYEYSAETDDGIWREYTKEIKLDANGDDTGEWTKTYQDMLGRGYKTVYPDGAFSQSWYNGLGQLWKSRDPDGVITLYQYNSKGELEYSVIDLNQDGVVDLTGTDRITRTLRDITTYAGVKVQRTRIYVHRTDGSSTTSVVAMTQTSTNGLSWQTAYKDQSTPVITASVRTVPDATGNYTVTVTYPDSASQVSAYSYGRLTSVTRKDSGGSQVSQTSYLYDAHGRTAQVIDARNGTTTYTYNQADQVVTITTPASGTGEPGQITTTFYDKLGRATGYQHPDGTANTNLYYQTGLLQTTWGSRSYPVEYTYDAQGRMRTMKTWQNFGGNSGTATTRWNYHPLRGWLASKDYPDVVTGNPPGTEGTGGPVYTNTAAGRLQTRVWKRGVTTTYAYNNAGDLQSVTYTGGSVSTPSTSYTYDRRGRRKTAVRNSITTTWTYNDADQPLTESNSGGTMSSLAMNWSYDNALRRDVLTAKYGTNILQAADYDYDTAGRLGKVKDGSQEAVYGYHPNSTLIATVALTNGPGTGAGLGVSRAYDRLNRLQSISSRAYGVAATNLPVSVGYQYNAANQRTRATLGDGTYWVYQYDALGQVVAGRRYWADGTEVAGQQFEYRFDDIGNRDTTGGRASAVSDYTANRLNQYNTRTVPPSVDVQGLANPTANVTVNGNVATRQGEYFHHALSVPNATAQYPTITVSSQYGGQQSQSGEVFVPAVTESFGYDADGNLTSDGRWTYLWDGENRLVEMKRDTSTPTLSSRLRLLFEYDAQGRRIRKYFYTHSGSSWVEQRDTICLYDGWNVVAEVDANASKARLRTYVWGSDLSGTIEGAGGVGGLLWVNNYQATYDGQTLPAGVHFVAYDGNGNVLALTRASDGSVSARYEYGPFGEPVRVTGALAAAQPFRFSTKWTDAETGLLYYGYRYYNPVTGRWVSRDPVEEEGGVALFTFVNNAPTSNLDTLGLACCGADVTRPTMATLKSIERHWNHSPLLKGIGKKASVCRTLVNPFFDEKRPDQPSAYNAWDIIELGYTSPRTPKCIFFDRGSAMPEDCLYSARFMGSCYNAGQINFAMFGLLFRLCRDTKDPGMPVFPFTEWVMVKAIVAYKSIRLENEPPPPAIYVQQAIGFARFAYNGYNALQAPPFRDCRLSDSRAPFDRFRWVMEPVCPRKPVQPPCASP